MGRLIFSSKWHRQASSVLAELSYGYPEIGEPQKTLDMREDITK